MTGTTLGALFVAGLLGSFGHCLGMCGPLVVLVGNRFPGRRIASSVVYHASRILVYAAMGAVVGALGSLFGFGGNLNALGAGVSIAMGLVVVALGLGYAGLLPAPARRSGVRWWNRATTWAFRRSGYGGAALLGALNGILPCGLVYGAFLVGARSGSAPGGALSMLVFGLATFPTLAIVQSSFGFPSPTSRLWLMRAAGAVVTAIGLQICLRGLAALDVVPSVRIGGLMLW